MNVVGKVSSLITQGVYSVATPFHPFGGAVDIIVVQQQDGSYRSTPWYVRFGKFQGVLKGAEKFVKIEVNGTEAGFRMNLDNSGEAYFIKEVHLDKDDEKNDGPEHSGSHEDVREDNETDLSNEANSRKDGYRGRRKHSVSGEHELGILDERVTLGLDRLERTESDGARFYDFQDEQFSLDSSAEPSEYGDMGHVLESQDSSGVILVSVDGHILTAPITSAEKNGDILNLDTPQFHLGPGKGSDFSNDNKEFSTGEDVWTTDYIGAQNTSPNKITSQDACSINMDDDSNNTNDDDTGLECHLASHDGRHHGKMQEAEDCADEGCKESPTTCRENESAGIISGEVFSSCLELTELANHVDNGDHIKKVPSSDDSKNLENLKEGYLNSSRAIYDDEHVSGDANGQLLPSSDTTPALSVGGDTCETTPLDSDHEISNSITNQLDHLDIKPEEHNELLTAEGKDVESQELLVGSKLEEHNDEGEIDSGTPSVKCEKSESETPSSGEETSNLGLELSVCKNLLHAGMGSSAAADVFDANRVSKEEFNLSASSIIKNENLVVRYRGMYLSWEKAAPIVLGLAAYGVNLPIDVNDSILVENEMLKTKEADSGMPLTPSGRRWRLWSIPFRRVKTLEHSSSISSNEEFVDPEITPELTPTKSDGESPHKQLVRTNVPTSDQIASLNLKEGQNMVTFIFSTRVLGVQKVDAHIYLWRYNARIVISDVDGTITKSDVLGQFMPLVGKDWTHSGIARLFSAIKENGYQLLFLSARAIVQAYLTRSFLLNLKQDGKTLPSGPVVISPDGLFPSLYREVIRRAPHEFKIACLEDIKALFPPDYNPFYAGFGNRDTDELSYRKIGIPKGKIFIINPKGEVAINNRVDVKSYTSLHTLVHDMFPPTSLVEQVMVV
ncbi:hypothetical protein Leryth_011695 [Lithospermum erythrorhizon]|nr:hypothetical protein Leryth_011695 [Lithospermum erythrorhizon]